MLMTFGMERLLWPWSARACASIRATSKGWFQHAIAPAGHPAGVGVQVCHHQHNRSLSAAGTIFEALM